MDPIKKSLIKSYLYELACLKPYSRQSPNDNYVQIKLITIQADGDIEHCSTIVETVVQKLLAVSVFNAFFVHFFIVNPFV